MTLPDYPSVDDSAWREAEHAIEALSRIPAYAGMMSDLEGLARYHAPDSVTLDLRTPTERRLAALEAQVAELTRRLDEQEGGK